MFRKPIAFAGIAFAFAISAVVGPADAGVTFETIYRFRDAARPDAGVIVNPADGRSLFGTTAIGNGQPGEAIFKLSPPATKKANWKKQNLYNFPGRDGGVYPQQVVPDGSGGLFGFTRDSTTSHYGTVFQATPDADPQAKWNATALYRFQGGHDGEGPSGLVRYGRFLIGTTHGGGSSRCTDPFRTQKGCGIVFALIPPATPGGTWTKKTIHAFEGGAGGATPSGRLLVRDNSIIGTAVTGGGGQCALDVVYGCGVVYQLLPPTSPGAGWTEKVLYSFTGGAQGGLPMDGVISDGANGLFGVTLAGGTNLGGQDAGTVYHLVSTEAGWRHRVIHAFSGGVDGFAPLAGLLMDPQKNKVLYGVTSSGGANRAGTAFRLEKSPDGSWSKTVLHDFSNGPDDGNPRTALVRDSSGALYGTTGFVGTVYRITVSP